LSTKPPATREALLLFGAGGHALVVADAAQRGGKWQRLAACDSDPARCQGELLPGVPLLPPQSAAAWDGLVHVSIGDNQAREREAQALGLERLASVLHPAATRAATVSVEAGCFVAAGAVLGPLSRLGAGVIVNHGAVVDHDCTVGDFTHVAPRAVLGGGVQLGRRVMLGAGAVVLPGVRVVDDAVIGAGAVVHRDLLFPGVYVGVPARRLR
jgi:sugar O-acyltransferase (sialic acid O-acetyltransferase NeuD family)